MRPTKISSELSNNKRCAPPFQERPQRVRRRIAHPPAGSRSNWFLETEQHSGGRDDCSRRKRPSPAVRTRLRDSQVLPKQIPGLRRGRSELQIRHKKVLCTKRDGIR